LLPLEAYLSHLLQFGGKCHLTHKKLNVPQVKQKSIPRIINQMALDSGTRAITFTLGGTPIGEGIVINLLTS
jgi:hypothetical protein